MPFAFRPLPGLALAIAVLPAFAKLPEQSGRMKGLAGKAPAPVLDVLPADVRVHLAH